MGSQTLHFGSKAVLIINARAERGAGNEAIYSASYGSCYFAPELYI